MFVRFAGLGVGALYDVFVFGSGLVCASGDGAGWWCRESDRFDCALLGLFGENETRRRASESLGRDDGLWSESDAEDELEECSGEWRFCGCDPMGGAYPDCSTRSSSAVLSTTRGS